MMAATPTKTKKREITKVMMRACRRRGRNLGFDFDGGGGGDVWGCGVVSDEDCCRNRERSPATGRPAFTWRRLFLGIEFLPLDFFFLGGGCCLVFPFAEIKKWLWFRRS
uniref:Transmembrane protein n=1 Tax=Opuntia streptacantha TaxID=393608 RepID=A0A7C9DJZ3_OPUST